MSTYFLIIFAVITALNFTFADITQFENCSTDDSCDISEVRIDPCGNPKLCKLRKGRRSSISFDYTPKFSSDKMLTGLFWANEARDVPFADLYEANGCNFTACPLEAGKKQDLNYSLLLGKKLPRGKFDIKWKLWNPDNAKESCCFKTAIELRK